MDIRFDDQVAVVTGAGNGLGRAHALELARRGAKVVVNDFGVGLDGRGGSSEAANKVVGEIVAAGGEAIADPGSVTSDADVDRMVTRTMDQWGRCDIVVNNAGALRDKSFAKMSMDDYEFVIDVHLNGTARVTRAFWPIMKAQRYGRVVFTTSTAGLYGNFGQANYGAAKMGMIGLMHVLMIEGAKDDIHINALSPVAATRMSTSAQADGGVELERRASAGLVSPGLAVLASREAPNGLVLNAGGGYFSAFKMFETEGTYLGRNGLTAEAVRDALPAIVAQDQLHHRANAQESSRHMLAAGDHEL